MTNFEMMLQNEKVKDFLFYQLRDYIGDLPCEWCPYKNKTKCNIYDTISCTSQLEKWLKQPVDETSRDKIIYFIDRDLR